MVTVAKVIAPVEGHWLEPKVAPHPPQDLAGRTQVEVRQHLPRTMQPNHRLEAPFLLPHIRGHEIPATLLPPAGIVSEIEEGDLVTRPYPVEAVQDQGLALGEQVEAGLIDGIGEPVLATRKAEPHGLGHPFHGLAALSLHDQEDRHTQDGKRNKDPDHR